LRALDKINPVIANPKRFCAVLAMLPFMLAGIGAIVAGEATPDQPIASNGVAVACFALCMLSFALILVPALFRWDWRAKFFGFSALYSSAPALIGLIPWACILAYGRLPVSSKIIVFLVYVVPITLWCRRFVRLYREIFDNERMRKIIYFEADDAVYFLQKGDKWLIEKI
jgi:hypothetical protein